MAAWPLIPAATALITPLDGPVQENCTCSLGQNPEAVARYVFPTATVEGDSVSVGVMDRFPSGNA